MLVACGMYAFSAALQSAWRGLFSPLPKLLFGDAAGRISVSFRADDDAYRNPALLLGHACGYPYLKKWADTHQPVCVPLFAVDGCEHTQYSSWFITPAAGTVTDLEGARGGRVAMNGRRSNSGMNVLRHAVAGLAGGERFFGDVVVSGSHLHSLEMVADGRVELAAIDAVTYALQIAGQPALGKRIRIIGQSAPTTAPPFIAPIASVPQSDHPAITDALNECLHNLDAKQRKALPLSGFRQVSAAAYTAIEALEKFALARDYPELA